MADSRKQQPAESSEELLAAQEQVFRQKRAYLLRHYAGQFVALYQGRVVGHGADDEALAQHLFERLGDVPFYIAKVEKASSVYELPSPEVIR